MKKQVIIGLMVLFLAIGMIGSVNASTTINDPTASEVLKGNFTLNVTTSTLCSWVGFNYSTDNVTWTSIGANTTEGTEFTYGWLTTAVGDGNYYINATSNRTESDWVYVSVDNVPDSPEFSTVMMAGLIGLLSVSAILLRRKEK